MGCGSSKEGDLAVSQPVSFQRPGAGQPPTQPPGTYSQGQPTQFRQQPPPQQVRQQPSPQQFKPQQAERQSAIPFAPGQVQPSWRSTPSIPGQAWPKTLRRDDLNFSVQLYIHEMDSPSQGGKFPCWSFVSEGLQQVKQPEIVFTVRQRRKELAENYPLAPLAWMRIIYLLAAKGSHLDVFQTCEINFGNKVQIEVNRLVVLDEVNQWADFRRFKVLLHGPRTGGISGLPPGGTPRGCHVVLGLTPNEAEVAKQYGCYRPVSQTGIAARFYPFASWLDRDRADACTMADQKGTVLATPGLYPVAIPGINVRQVVNDILLTIPKGEDKRQIFTREVRGRDVTDALILLSTMSGDATAGYLWKTKQTAPSLYGTEAAAKPGAKINRDFSAISICPGNPKEEEWRVIEDTCLVYFSVAAWSRMREAILTRRDISVPLTDNSRFTIQWEKSVYHNPLDGQDYRAQDGVVGFSDLLTGDPHLTRMMASLREPGPDDYDNVLAYYVNVDNVIRNQIPNQPPRTAGTDVRKQVIFDFELPKGGEWLKLLAYPSADGLALSDICQKIAGIPEPRVREPVRMQLIYNLWGFEGGPALFS